VERLDQWKLSLRRPGWEFVRVRQWTSTSCSRISARICSQASLTTKARSSHLTNRLPDDRSALPRGLHRRRAAPGQRQGLVRQVPRGRTSA